MSRIPNGPRSSSRRSLPLVLIALAWLGLFHDLRAAAAKCEEPGFERARDDERYVAAVDACTRAEATAPETSALLAYFHRNGFGVPRDAAAARAHYESALALEPCNPHAVCGLRRLSGDGSGLCEIDCESLVRQSLETDEVVTGEIDARDRAYQLLAEMQGSGSAPVRLAADELAVTLERILAQEESSRDEAYRELCTGYIKRAVVTVSLAFQLERETRRRAKLIAYHEEKVRNDNSARSQAALQALSAAQRRAKADRQVFFEKYTGATFSAGNCDEEALEASYESFEREVAEVRITELERRAFELFRDHVEAARAGEGISSEWFGNLEELLAD